MIKDTLEPTDFKRGPLLVLIILLMVPLSGISSDMYAPALPIMADALHTNSSALQFTVGIYLFGYALSQPFVGVLSDSYGRKKLALIMISIYFLASVAAMLATNIEFFLLMRFIQGVGVAGGSMLAKAIQADCFSGKELAKITNTQMLVWALGPLIAPVVGSYVTHYLDWRINFGLLSAYALMLLILIGCYLPETNLRPHLLSVSKVLNSYSRVLTSTFFLACVYTLGSITIVYFLFAALGPFILQTDLGLTVVEYGHVAFVLGVVLVAGSFITRLLLNHFSVGSLVYVGTVVVFVAAVIMFLLGMIGVFNLYSVLVPVAIIFFFANFFTSYAQAKCLSLFPDIRGTAGSIMNTGLVGLAAIVTSVASLFQANNQLSLATVYFVALAIYIILFFTIIRSELRNDQE